MKMQRPSPRKLLGELSLRELGLWAALWRIDPWDEARADLRSGITSYVIAETNRDSKKKSTPYKPSDFMPYVRAKMKTASDSVSSRLRAALQSFPKRKG